MRTMGMEASKGQASCPAFQSHILSAQQQLAVTHIINLVLSTIAPPQQAILVKTAKVIQTAEVYCKIYR